MPNQLSYFRWGWAHSMRPVLVVLTLVGVFESGAWVKDNILAGLSHSSWNWAQSSNQVGARGVRTGVSIERVSHTDDSRSSSYAA
eukprot:scaffold90812_cov49-Attheya_sp.AAC.1